MAKRIRMLTLLLILATLSVLLLLVLVQRLGTVANATHNDQRNQLPVLLSRHDATTMARFDALDATLRATVDGLRAEIAQLRRDSLTDAERSRESAHQSALALREELTKLLSHLGQTLTAHLGDFRTHSIETLGAHRTDSSATSEALRLAVRKDFDAIQQRLLHFVADTSRHQAEARDSLHNRLHELGTAQQLHQDRLRSAVEQRLDLLNTTNAAKLEEMRATVDEKLHATLHTRLSESFGQVTTHLGEVHKGLGEMKELANGVGDLKRVLSNVKSRGVVGEFQLGLQLEQMFSPEQYIKNARIKPASQECVEFALKLPSGQNETTLLPIDAKFPREDWERLEYAYEQGTPEQIAVAGKSFERAIRAEGKRICEKYIDPPTTLRHAIMFLPTEGLYAEVVRRPGLLSELQQQYQVTIAGPSTFMAILTSFQMGFHTLAIERKGTEVWTVLSRTKEEFAKFGGLMDKVEKQVGTVQNTLKEINGKTSTINRALRDVASPHASQDTLPEPAAAVVPLLAAVSEQEN